MNGVNPFRLLIKALIIFGVINLTYAVLNPPVDALSIYNWLIPGRRRFFMASAQASTSGILVGIDELFNSHIISRSPKPPTEYRVFFIGDSQTWGVSETPAQTIPEQLNNMGMNACGKFLKFYNLAFPYTSVVKDFLILNRSLIYKPDLIVWMLSASSLFPGPDPVLNFLTNVHPQIATETLHQYHLEQYTSAIKSGIKYKPSIWQQTIIGQSRYLASLALLQLNGLVWAATNSDSQIPQYNAMNVDLPATQKFGKFQPPNLPRSIFSWDVLAETHTMLGGIPVLVVNEPIYLPHGKNSDINYNARYPRWAYDQYREYLQDFTLQNGWMYLDLFNSIPYQEFTNSIWHITPQGEARLAQLLAPEIQNIACP